MDVNEWLEQFILMGSASSSIYKNPMIGPVDFSRLTQHRYKDDSSAEKC